MPHGLTPLGRQLRSVLAAISSPCRHDVRRLSAIGRSRGGAAHCAGLRAQYDNGGPHRRYGSVQAGGRPAVDGLVSHARKKDDDLVGAQELGVDRAEQHVATVSDLPLGKDLSVNTPPSARERSGPSSSRTEHRPNDAPTEKGPRHGGHGKSQVKEVDQEIKGVDHSDPEWTDLENDGHGQGDYEELVDGMPDCASPAALDALLRRIATGKAQPPMLDELGVMLRGASPRARSLSRLLHLAWTSLSHCKRTTSWLLTPTAVLETCTQLICIAREVWPQCLDSIAQLLVHFMKACDKQKPTSSLTTQCLNEAMWQISLPLSVSPFKDIGHQETAIIRILSFMADRKPSIQIDRQGYRAVIRMQLAQPKTESEQRWAKLKALSWPPWKEDRTAMDSEIGPEHGISRAGATLRRMQEAGYAPTTWERVAMIYSGWDTDNTPTIQRRVHFMPREVDSKYEASYIWAARIECTRTVQEAWACFEAAQAARVHRSQMVLHAILQKLHEEEHRQALALARETVQYLPLGRDLLPGDTTYVEPPPPSTHQHTFTRTPPPKMHDFYEQSTKGGRQFKGSSLAYLVANARSHQVGTKYLRDAQDRYPGVVHLMHPAPALEGAKPPPFLLAAYVTLLSKTSTNIRVHSYVNSGWRLPPSDRLRVETLHPRSALVRAVTLLQRSGAVNMQAYAIVLRAFGRISLTEESYILRPEVFEPCHPFEAEMKVLTAYRLTHYVLDLLASRNRDPDVPSFLNLCYATENAALACWRILTASQRSVADDWDSPAAANALAIAEAEGVLGSLPPVQHLVGHFHTLTGINSEPDAIPATPHPATNSTCSPDYQLPNLPRLLNVPSPAVLHAYIRALGWDGAHDQLHATLRFMATYETELAEQRAKDRGGEEHWRLCVVAARVFLERQWLNGVSLGDTGCEESTSLRAFVESASVEMVVECRSIVDECVGGWATDEEVEVYVRKGWERFGAVVKIASDSQSQEG